MLKHQLNRASRLSKYKQIAEKYEHKVLSTLIKPRTTQKDRDWHKDMRSLWARAWDALSDNTRKLLKLALRRGNRATARVRKMSR